MSALTMTVKPLIDLNKCEYCPFVWKTPAGKGRHLSSQAGKGRHPMYRAKRRGVAKTNEKRARPVAGAELERLKTELMSAVEALIKFADDKTVEATHAKREAADTQERLAKFHRVAELTKPHEGGA